MAARGGGNVASAFAADSSLLGTDKTIDKSSFFTFWRNDHAFHEPPFQQEGLP